MDANWSDNEEEYYEEECEMIDEDVNEDEVLRLMDEMEPPLRTCSRVFYAGDEVVTSVLPKEKQEELKANGFIVIDNFCPSDLVCLPDCVTKTFKVGAAYNETTKLVEDGKLLPAHRPSTKGYDINARSDLTTFLKLEDEGAHTTAF